MLEMAANRGCIAAQLRTQQTGLPVIGGQVFTAAARATGTPLKGADIKTSEVSKTLEV